MLLEHSVCYVLEVFRYVRSIGVQENYTNSQIKMTAFYPNCASGKVKVS